MRQKLVYHRSVLGISKAIIKAKKDTTLADKFCNEFLGVLRKKKLYGKTPSHEFGDFRIASNIAKANYFCKFIQGCITLDLEAKLKKEGNSYLELHREMML
jgi:hypothetical protein